MRTHIDQADEIATSIAVAHAQTRFQVRAMELYKTSLANYSGGTSIAQYVLVPIRFICF